MLKNPSPVLKIVLSCLGLLAILTACGDTPTVTPTKIDLAEAAAKGLVIVTINGNGLDLVKITLESKSPNPLNLTISSGLILQAQSNTTQSLVVRDKREVSLNEQQKAQTVTVPVVSLSMHLAPPQSQDTFVIAKLTLPPDLVKLLNLPDFSKEPFRVQQFAIWTLTDNPARKDYAKVGSTSTASGPDSSEIQRIRMLFGKATISITGYQGLAT